MIDTHAHLHLIRRSIDNIILAAKEAGVSHIIQVAIDEDSIRKNIDVYHFYDELSISGGIHPLSVSESSNIISIIDYIELNASKFCAIGEIGLDYKYGFDNKDLQIEWFYAQLDLAKRLNLPAIIHSRHSDEDMLAIVNQYPDVKKVFHCYATNLDFYEALVGDCNYVSFTGMITYSKKGKVVNALRNIPFNRMMIETDAPYLLPSGIKVEQNAPEFVGKVAEYIAHLREIEYVDVVDQTTKTAQSFFGI